MAWRNIERVEFDLDEAQATLIASGEDVGSFELLNTDYDTVLIIGSDSRSEEYIGDQVEAYADAVILYLSPKDDGDPILVSIPRDLRVEDPCTGTDTKLDRTLTACDGNISEIAHVGLAVQQYTGVAIEDVAVIDFEGFIDVIDLVGGIELCSKYALREGGNDLLAAGCSTVDGTTALAWVRSRQTQEFVDGKWRFVEGVGDAIRSERQQLLLLGMLSKLKAMRSPAMLADVVGELGDSLQLGDNLTMAGALGRAWELRRLSASSIRRLTIPVADGVLDDGSYVSVATRSFLEVIQEG